MTEGYDNDAPFPLTNTYTKKSFSYKTPRIDGGIVYKLEEDVVKLIYFSNLLVDGWKAETDDGSVVSDTYQLLLYFVLVGPT
jgi:hypothetical protein